MECQKERLVEVVSFTSHGIVENYLVGWRDGNSSLLCDPVSVMSETSKSIRVA